MIFIYIFYDLEGWMSLAYVSLRDQNLVVQGRNYRLIGFVFLLVLKKSFKVKKSSIK